MDGANAPQDTNFQAIKFNGHKLATNKICKIQTITTVTNIK